MNKRVTIQFADFIKSRLAGGLLCCLVLLAAYLFQMFFPGMYVDAFSSSFYLFAWLILFVGALLWTLREKGTSGLPSEITDWQCIAAFLLIVANQIYVVMPKEVHVELNFDNAIANCQNGSMPSGCLIQAAAKYDRAKDIANKEYKECIANK